MRPSRKMTDFTIVYGRFLSDDLAGINSYTELQNTISYRRCERNTGNAQRDILLFKNTKFAFLYITGLQDFPSTTFMSQFCKFLVYKKFE